MSEARKRTEKSTPSGGDRIFIRRVLIVLALVSLFFLLWQLRALLLMVFGAVVIASMFRALADRIRKLSGIPDGVAVALSVLLILGTLGLFVILFGAQLVAQARLLGDVLPEAWQSIQQQVTEMGLGEQLRSLMASIQSSESGAFSGLGRMIMSLGTGIADALVVIVGGIFLAAQPHFYRDGAIKLVPAHKRALMGEAMDDSERALRLWLKGQLFAMTVVGLLIGFGLWLIGLESALALGLLAGLLEFVPYIGPIVAAVPAILLALAAGPDLTFWVVLLYFAVQQFEGYLLQPLVQQYAVDLPGVILLFSLIGFGMLFGVLGIILAAPLTVVAYVLVKRLYVQEALHTATPIPGEKNA